MIARTTGAGLAACGRVTALAIGCLAANLGCGVRHASAAQCVLKRTGSADISIRNDRILVPVVINGHRATMGLNTAAASTWISSAYMKPFGLKPDHNFGVTWSGTQFPSAKVAFTALVMVGSQGFRNPGLIAFSDGRPPSADTAPYVGQLGSGLM